MLIESVFAITLASVTGPCAAALEAAPQYAACAEGRTGMALSADQEGADRLLARAETAEPRFRQHFPGEIRPYVVFYFDEEPPLDALRSAGFDNVLAWPSPAKVGELMAAALRQNALAGADSGAELSEEAETALRAQTAAVLASLEARQEDVIAHELGHLWYEAAFWRDNGTPADGYGTPAPDWLDETAAVLTEGDALAERRRALFARGWAAVEPAARSAPEAIGDLAHLLQRRHPSQTRETAPADPGASGSVTVTVRTAPDGKEAFYNQVRVFADYLLMRSGDDTVFSGISRALAGGGTFEAWLSSQTRYPALPATIPGLQDDWNTWIAAGALTPRTSPPAPAAGPG